MISKKYDKNFQGPEVIEDGHDAHKGVWTDSPEAKKEFMKVDREDEDFMVKKYKDTEDADLLDKLYRLREPTLKVWARKHAYLGDSEEDVFADLRAVWLKCVNSYKYEPAIRAIRTKRGGFVTDENGRVKTSFKRTPFNTFFYTSLRNYISNVIKKRYSKKRIDEFGVPLKLSMKSLDYEYEGEDGGGQSMHDVIADESSTNAWSKMDAIQIIEEISGGDQDVQDVLEAFAYDPHIKKISTACKLCKGTVPISREEKKILTNGGDEGAELLTHLIEFSGRYDKDFRVLSYQVFRRRVDFEVYGQDTKILKKVQRAISAYQERESCSN